MHYPRLLALALACATATIPMLADPAGAQTRAEIRQTVEATMVLTGTLDLSPTGTVDKVHLDKEDQVDPGIVGTVNRLVSGWRFEPVIRDGRAVPARTPLRMRLLAQQTGDGGLAISVASARFDNGSETVIRTDSVQPRKLTPPKFPEKLFYMGGVGEVTLLLEIGRDGRPQNVAVEQVNLRVILREHLMRRMRDGFMKASVDAAKRWEFDIPTTGEYADAESWTVRVPVNYYTNREVAERYGQWQAYVPGPKSPAAWNYKGKGTAEDNGDLLTEGGVYMAGISKGPKLLTPLGG